MKQITRKVDIVWKYNPSSFDKLNQEVLGEPYRKIGSSISAVAKMIEKSEMLRFLMPIILNVDPSSNNVNWDNLVKNYWDSLSVEVNSGGKTLETGFAFDIDDIRRTKWIDALAKEHNLKTDEDLAEYVMGMTGDKPKVHEHNRWKYGHPINVEDYLLWMYILEYRPVANRAEDVNKSPNIRFFLNTQAEKERVKKDAFKSKQRAITAYMDFMKDASIDDINDIMSVLKPNSIKEIIANRDREEKQADLLDMANNDPNKFVKIIGDKNLKTRAFIERLETFGILKKHTNSTILVDASDPSVTIGNNVDEAITFFSNEKNKAKISEFTAKYKSLKF